MAEQAKGTKRARANLRQYLKYGAPALPGSPPDFRMPPVTLFSSPSPSSSSFFVVGSSFFWGAVFGFGAASSRRSPSG